MTEVVAPIVPVVTPANGADPTKTSAPVVATLDLTKVGDEDFSKVFDDPRLWEHPRFKSLNAKAKRVDEIEAAKQEAEKQRLIEQGKFKELAEAEKNNAESWKQKYNQSMIDNSIIASSSKLGVVDVEAAKALIDRKDIKLNDDGSVTGVEEAVKALLTSKPYLKGSPSNNLSIGSGTSPGDQASTAQKFKLSQIKDVTFFREHEKEIMQAQKLGLIENDG